MKIKSNIIRNGSAFVIGLASSFAGNFLWDPKSVLELNWYKFVFITFFTLVCIVSAIVIFFSQRSIKKRSQDYLEYINQVYKQILDIKFSGKTEQEFHEWIKSGVIRYLNSVFGLLSLKYKVNNILKNGIKRSKIYSVFYFIGNDGNLLSKTECFKKYRINENVLISSYSDSIQKELEKNPFHNFYGWVLKQEITQKKNIERNASNLSSKEVWAPELSFDETQNPQQKVNGIKSGYSILLEYQGEKIGIFGVGASEEYGIYVDECIYLQKIAYNILHWLIHAECFCPWHKSGWRQANARYPIESHKFHLNLNNYNKSSITKKLTSLGFQTFIPEYLKRIRDMNKEGITAVYITGSFNGWCKYLSTMENGVTRNVWEGFVNLPISSDDGQSQNGYYEFCYLIKTPVNEYYIFDQSLDLKQGAFNSLNSILVI